MSQLESQALKTEKNSETTKSLTKVLDQNKSLAGKIAVNLTVMQTMGTGYPDYIRGFPVLPPNDELALKNIDRSQLEKRKNFFR